MLNRDWIVAHIPHQGSMCLLDSVRHWDDTSIECQATSHAFTSNPLRAHGRLGIAAGVEYAAQAMAVHGALLSQSTDVPKPGYLGSVRNVHAYVSRLDDLVGPLDVKAQRLSGDDKVILYSFELTHQGRCLLVGRASVVLNASGI